MPILNYDDSAFGFFAITFLALYTVPASIYIARTILYWKPEDEADVTAKARSAAEANKLQTIAAGKPKRILWSPRFKAMVGLTVAAALSLLVLTFTIGTMGQLAAYDPYAILNLPAGSSEREVKQAYRKLSMQHHPDKGGNAELFQKIAKAYEALSDPTARENWEKYGNPDGKQALEVAIGIPSILLHPQARYVFLAIYIVLLVVAIPYVMRKVWQTNKGKTVFGLLEGSLRYLQGRLIGLAKLPKTLPESYASIMELHTLKYDPLTHLAQGGELQNLCALLADEKHPRIFMAADSKGNQLQGIPRANNILLHAYMNRLAMSPSLKALLPSLLEHLPSFINYGVGLYNRAQYEYQVRRAMKKGSGEMFIETAFEVCTFGAMATQALYGKESSLLQVLSKSETEAVLTAKRNLNMRGLLDMPAEDRDKLLTAAIGPSSGSAVAPRGAARNVSRRDEVDAVLKDLPVLEGSIHFGVKSHASDSSTAEGKKTKKEKEEDKNKIDESEFEPAIYEGNIMTATIQLRHRGLADKDPLPPVYAPNYPGEAKEEWHVWVMNEKGEVMHLGPAEEGAQLFYLKLTPQTGLETIQLLMPAPKAETYRVMMLVKSSVYLGLDIEVEGRFTVRRKEDAPRGAGGGAGAIGDEADGEADPDADEDDDDELLRQRDETVERMWANDDDSDVSDDEGDDEGDSKAAKKSARKARSADAAAGGDASEDGAQAADSSTDSGAGALTASGAGKKGPSSKAAAALFPDSDDGWAPSILAGAAKRRNVNAKKAPQ